MDHVEVPRRTFDYLLTGFVCHEAIDLARSYAESGIAHPGDPFGNVFAWLWEANRGNAVSLFADLLAEARRHAPEGKGLKLDDLIRDPASRCTTPSCPTCGSTRKWRGRCAPRCPSTSVAVPTYNGTR